MGDRSQRLGVVAAFLVVCVVWGSTYLAIRIALESFPPFLGASLRITLAGAIFYAVLRARGAPAPTAIEWRSAAITGFLFFVTSNALVVFAEQSVSSGLASVLVATMPLWATLIERILGARISRLEQCGMALGVVGVVALNFGGDLRGNAIGATCALVAPMSWAIGSIVSKRVALPAGAMCTAAQMIAGGLATGIVATVRGERMDHAPSARSVIAVAYLIAFGSILAFTSYVYLLRHTRTAVATSYAYVNPVIALVLGVVFAGERIDRVSAIGALCVVAAVVLVVRGKSRPAEAKPSSATSVVTPCELSSSER